MGEKTDRRKLRTKRMLRKALLELIEEKGIEGVTVSDLTERADVNRGTFYLHYRDTAELMHQLKEEIFVGLTEKLRFIRPLELASYSDRDRAYPPAVQTFEYILEHRDFFRVILGPNGDPAYMLQIKKFMMEHLTALFPRDAGNPAVPPDYLFAYITSAQLGVLQHWFETGNQLTPAEVALLITRIVSNGPLKYTQGRETGHPKQKG